MTLFDKYLKDVAFAFAVIGNMKGYATFNPADFSLTEEETERLKSIPFDDRMGSSPTTLKPPRNKDTEQKTLHEQNMEAMRLNYEQSMELEALRNRRSFDSIAMADLETILTSEDTEGVVITKRLSAIAWCHQQAVLLPSSAATLLNVGGGIGIENAANYLFKTFFPDLNK